MSGAAGRREQWKPRYNPWLVAITVTLGAFMEVLDTTIVNVSLPHIAGSLSVSPNEATWTLTTYLVANGIDSPEVTAVGLGETQPMALEDTEEGKALNRRVEVVIRPPSG